MARLREEFEEELIVGEVPPAFKKAKLDNSNNLDSGHGDDNGKGYGNGEVENGCTDGDEPSSHLNGGFEQEDNQLDHDHDHNHDVERHDSAENPISGGVSSISNNYGKNSGVSSDVTAKKRSKPWKLYAKPGGDGKGMHDANLYRRYRPDFRELATEYPDTFGPHVIQEPSTGRATIDWKKPESMRALTQVMLKHDFGIDWNVPLDRLCPPVPNRLNYICWLSDLMKLRQLPSGSDSPGEGVVGRTCGESAEAMCTEAERNLFLFGTSDGDGDRYGDGNGDRYGDGDGDRYGDGDGDRYGDGDGDGGEILDGNVESGGGKGIGRAPHGKPCKGIDIGTGASCIYPLLGVSVMGNWSFIATDTDAVSAEWAKRNVRSNGLQDRIEVRVVRPSDIVGGEGPGPLLTALTEDDVEDFDFCMANPPFFASEDEAGQNPDSATRAMATASEVSCHGGEEAFVQAIIRDSFCLKQKVRWYTTMIGKKSNAKKLLRTLRQSGVKNMRTTEFFQGRTVRWGLAWSFTSEGMVGHKIPDSPSVKVFSKKKVAERRQQSLRSFSVPLRPLQGSYAEVLSSEGRAGDAAAAAAAAAATTADERPLVEVTVPGNLPCDADDVVERLRSSLKSFRQADIKMEDVVDNIDPALYTTIATTASLTSTPRSNSSSSAANTTDVSEVTRSCLASSVQGLRNPNAARRFCCEARPPASGTVDSSTAASEVGTATVGATPLFSFELEVHGAAGWAGAPAQGTSVRVWAKLREGGDRGAFQRVWEVLQHDVLRQNRRWRRDMSRASSGRGGGDSGASRAVVGSL